MVSPELGLRFGLLAVLLGCTAPAAGQGPVLVTDLNTQPTGQASSSSPSRFVDIAGTTLFSADVPGFGRELYATGGTAATTALVADIQAGAGSSDPRELTPLGNVWIFSATTAGAGRELWRSDGTAAGTFQLVDIAPGAADSNPSAFTELLGELYFVLDDGSFDLWKTDGTAAGTVQVKAIRAGGSLLFPPAMTAQGGRLYFSAPNLWISDGTAAGTTSLDPMVPIAVTPLGSSVIALDASNGVYRCTPAGATWITHTFSGPAMGENSLQRVGAAPGARCRLRSRGHRANPALPRPAHRGAGDRTRQAAAAPAAAVVNG